MVESIFISVVGITLASLIVAFFTKTNSKFKDLKTEVVNKDVCSERHQGLDNTIKHLEKLHEKQFEKLEKIETTLNDVKVQVAKINST